MHDVFREKKVAVYQAVVLTTLLYGCETWDTLPTICPQARPVSSALPTQNSWNKMARQGHQYRRTADLRHHGY